jgi:hypothetical protein
VSWQVPSKWFPIHLPSYHFTVFSLNTDSVVSTKNTIKGVLQWSTIFYGCITYSLRISFALIFVLHRCKCTVKLIMLRKTETMVRDISFGQTRLSLHLIIWIFATV